jgi:hypothetical protein
MERLQIVNGFFIRRHREKCTVLCANYFRILNLHLTQADLMTGSMYLRPFCIMKMGRNIGNKCIMTYYSRVKVSGRADTQLAIQFNNYLQY